MAKTICVLNQHEGELLRQGTRPKCGDHSHCKFKEARTAVNGSKYDTDATSFDGEARWAVLEDGNPSQRHIIITQAYVWRRVQTRIIRAHVGLVAIGVATMQLVALRKRRREDQSSRRQPIPAVG